MNEQELRFQSLRMAMDLRTTAEVDDLIELAEKIYSYLIKDGVDNKDSDDGGWSHHQCPNSNCRKVFE